MLKILAVADNEKQTAEIRELLGRDCSVISTTDAAEELNKNNYDLVISAPENVFFHKKLYGTEDLNESCIHKLTESFFQRGNMIGGNIRSIKAEVISAFTDLENAEYALREIYTRTADNVFEKNEWLELYIPRDDNTMATSAQLEEQLLLLYKEYIALFPKSNDTTEEVILYILNNPESDLKQKTIASKLYINSSYLSTVFAAQTGMRFVDYLTAVKIKRAAYLLMNTTLSISEIAARLDYKDIGYFSRLFKSRLGMPPSQYRMPYSYTYEI